MTPFAAPKKKAAGRSRPRRGARRASGKATSSVGVAMRVTAALPKRAMNGPVSGMAASAPSAMAKSAMPSVEWLI